MEVLLTNRDEDGLRTLPDDKGDMREEKPEEFPYNNPLCTDDEGRKPRRKEEGERGFLNRDLIGAWTDELLFLLTPHKPTVGTLRRKSMCIVAINGGQGFRIHRNAACLGGRDGGLPNHSDAPRNFLLREAKRHSSRETLLVCHGGIGRNTKTVLPRTIYHVKHPISGSDKEPPTRPYKRNRGTYLPSDSQDTREKGEEGLPASLPIGEKEGQGYQEELYREGRVVNERV